MRYLLSRLAFFLGALAFSYACTGWAMLHGPLSPQAVMKVADTFATSQTGQKLVEDAITEGLTAAGVDQAVSEKVRAAFHSQEGAMQSVAYEISSKWVLAMGETPTARPEGVVAFEDVTKKAMKDAGVPKQLRDNVVISIPAVKLPMAKALRDQAERRTVPLLKLAGMLLGLSVLVAARRGSALKRVGRMLCGASVFYVTLGIGVPRLVENSSNETLAFTGLLLKAAFSGIVSVAVVALAAGAALVMLPPRLMKH